ncbi:hypothetical protein [Albimonas pacifica]|uniref:PNPLA domain-containing protein n=1 Tax=Albimonas pacifica TaxID=1114924 RepID=A0A1I3E6W3_9RHOB|nr:hypothetical protein [Albimonas pacifica]SFH94441.1 hypothetical protein SAMN05216258_103207 [Albimonas pacifica]
MSDASSEPGDPPPFLLGLTLAGSVSAGAYLAGVVDFLVRALEAHAAANPDRPVVLKVLSGTSGGGTSASLLVASLLDGIGGGEGAKTLAYVDPDGEARSCGIGLGRLHRLWVEELDLAGDAARTGMLDVEDLEAACAAGRPIPSLLSGLAIDRAADRALGGARWRRGRPYPFLARPLDLFVTTTNLQGVVYGVQFAAGARHAMSRHGMARHFSVEGLGAHPVGSAWLDAYLDAGVRIETPAPGEPVDLRAREAVGAATAWTELRESAVASGAFPVGFPARFVPTRMGEHALLDPAKPGEGGAWPLEAARFREGTDPAATRPNVMPAPDWGAADPAPDGDATYVAIDGGVINNEPFEYARYTLRRAREGAAREGVDWLAPNPRDAKTADRAVIMVDAFPEGGVFGAVSPGNEDDVAAAGLPGVIGGMFAALLAQARFKPAELVAAYDAAVKSRFMIAPSRDPLGDEAPVYSSSLLACGAMGGFSGFLDRRFREHDFILGQRNCQRFLARHFTLHPENPFFAAAGPWSGAEGEERPIVELTGPLAEPIAPPALPKMTLAELEALGPGILGRADGLARTALASAAPGWLVRIGLRAWWRLAGRDQAGALVLRRLEAALVEHGLMELALEPELRRALARADQAPPPGATLTTPARRKVLGLLILAGARPLTLAEIGKGLARARRRIGDPDALPARTLADAPTDDATAMRELLDLLAACPQDHPYRVEATAAPDGTPAWRLARLAGPGVLARVATLIGRAVG